MGWIRTNLHWLLLVSFLVTTLSTVAVGGLAVVAALAAVLTLDPVLVLETVLPYVAVLVVLGVLDVVLFVGAIVVALRRVSVPKSERLAGAFRRLEAFSPAVADLGLSRRVEPSLEQRRETLKERYAAGEITHREFERRTAELLAEEERTADGGPDAGASRHPGLSGRRADRGRRRHRRDRGADRRRSPSDRHRTLERDGH